MRILTASQRTVQELFDDLSTQTQPRVSHSLLMLRRSLIRRDIGRWGREKIIHQSCLAGARFGV